MRFQTLFVLDLQGKVKERAVKNAEYGREATDPEDFFLSLFPDSALSMTDLATLREM